ncbi:3'-5' exonuclease [Dethiosulfovibrio sp. F2B]|uniref:3'-5' exonuclease n=1 Tax=Dethiosulfovibrio faecalis TaxID=2720018 RepID=UPI001F46E7F9|nr:3'-5' exonuclease [Dethiosulfovibrio faecalis]MCF4151991.1 3'-5' exonuclease [Dethiosulfovibrio faecalis]
MDKSLWDSGFVAIDVETTGLSSRWDRIVEIGALRFTPGSEIESFQTFVYSGRPIPSEAVAIHGITDEMVEGAPGLSEASAALASFLKDEEPMVFHNPSFDLGFLDVKMREIKGSWDIIPVFDTCELARKAFPGIGGYSLVALARHFGFSGGGHHRALEDCRYSASLFYRILETIDGFRCMSLKDLISDYSFRS